MKKKYYYLFILAGALVCCIPLYTAWNRMDPNYTCARCHEVAATCHLWRSSAHANVACIDCHGTAFSGGLPTAMEKLNMVYTHFTTKKTNEDIHLSEKQALDVANRCATCHQAEDAAWKSGAHSATYKDIFLDTAHNRMEKPYWDCFRCHGMYYDGTINDLMSFTGSPEEWTIKDKAQQDHPTILCLSCHQVHAEQKRAKAYKEQTEEERTLSLASPQESPAALYVRTDKRHLKASNLQKPTIYKGDSTVNLSDDAPTRLCIQCHSPNGRHQAGTEDDMTPLAHYEGMSCTACHDPHSNKLKNSYQNVHKGVHK